MQNNGSVRISCVSRGAVLAPKQKTSITVRQQTLRVLAEGIGKLDKVVCVRGVGPLLDRLYGAVKELSVPDGADESRNYPIVYRLPDPEAIILKHLAENHVYPTSDERTFIRKNILPKCKEEVAGQCSYEGIERYRGQKADLLADVRESLGKYVRSYLPGDKSI